MDSDLSLEFLRVVEQAAVACAHTMGQGDRRNSDHVAVEAMRQVMDTVPIDGTIVIGEGERDEAPMLYIGEKVGIPHATGGSAGRRCGSYDAVDIAVDPLEGTNLCATGAPNAIAVLAASEKGGLLHAPDIYMEKLVVGPSSKDVVSLDAPVKENLEAIAKVLGRKVAGSGRRGAGPRAARPADRRYPRHWRAHSSDRRRRPVGRHRRRGGRLGCARGDGHRRRPGRRADAPRRCAASTAKSSRGWSSTKPEHEERCRQMGITDVKRIYRSADLAPGQGNHLRGHRRHRWHADAGRAVLRRRHTHQFGDHAEHPHRIRFIDSIHVSTHRNVKIRF